VLWYALIAVGMLYVLINHTIQGVLRYHAVLLRKIRLRLQLGHVRRDLSNIGWRVEWHLQGQRAQISRTRTLAVQVCLVSSICFDTSHCLIPSCCSGSKRKTEEPCAADSLMFLDIDGMAEE
jgi:hypothetical protein